MGELRFDTFNFKKVLFLHNLMTNFQMNIDTFGQVNMMYACISVLRALSLKSGPQKIFHEYTVFESHLEERMKTEVYNKVRKITFTLFSYLILTNFGC